jgi:hypothetical protein
MYVSYQFKEISEFERAALKLRFIEELKQLNEIQMILEEALYDLNISKKIYTQRIKAKKLASSLKGKIEQVEFDKHLKMLTLSMQEMKKVRKALKKRIINRIDPSQLLLDIAFLEEKLNDEITRSECGLETDFKGVLVSQKEMEILLETIAV